MGLGAKFRRLFGPTLRNQQSLWISLFDGGRWESGSNSERLGT